MSHTPHELPAEFPEHADAIHRLKVSNAEFARLFDEYHTVNRAIHRAETNVEPTDELNEHKMRKERMELKDQLYQMIKEEAGA
jgi:uncharacterized protein YdcH (DUF465 family)